VCVMEDVARVHSGEADDATVGDRDECVRVAPSAQAGESRGDVRGGCGIAEVSEQLRHRRRVVVARRPDIDHLRTGTTVARQIA